MSSWMFTPGPVSSQSGSVMQSPGPLRTIVYKPAGITVGGPLVVPTGAPFGSVTVTWPLTLKLTISERLSARMPRARGTGRSAAASASAAASGRHGSARADRATARDRGRLARLGVSRRGMGLGGTIVHRLGEPFHPGVDLLGRGEAVGEPDRARHGAEAGAVDRRHAARAGEDRATVPVPGELDPQEEAAGGTGPRRLRQVPLERGEHRVAP